MDPLKEAFSRIKEEIEKLRNEVSMLYSEIGTIRSELIKIKQNNPTDNPTQTHQILTTYNNKTDNPTDNPTQNTRAESPITRNMEFSIGNNGVSTDKQTYKQADMPIVFLDNQLEKVNILDNSGISHKEFEYANKIMDSLDDVKKQIRHKFKQLTRQEWTVFSIIYSLEEQGLSEITYKTLARHLKLSESSIRDYVNRLLNKGIPIEKTRLNNKTILLSISESLKKITTLPTLMQLREL